MIEAILLGVLSAMPPAQTQAQFRPCVWPNRCAVEAVEVAQFRPCVWPNRCSRQAAQEPDVQTCELPNRCS